MSVQQEPTPSRESLHAVSTPTQPVAHEESGNLDSDSVRLAQSRLGSLDQYLDEGDVITGFGYGGSESLTLFLNNAAQQKVVRKILSEPLITPQWDGQGRDVMLPPYRKARSQAEWLMGLPEDVKPLFPLVFGFRPSAKSLAAERDGLKYEEFIYDMSFVGGLEVSRFVRDYRPRPDVVALLYSELFAMLRTRVHKYRQRVPQGPTLEQSYFAKIDKRLALSHKTAPLTFSRKLLESDSIILNGRLLSNVPELLSVFRNNVAFRSVLEPRYHSLVAGDTNTENIKIGNIEPLLAVGDAPIDFANPPFTAADLDIRFLDPRAIGFHEDGADTGSDDPMYDNKPWHNSLGNYDMIHGEHFDIELSWKGDTPAINIDFHADNPYSTSYAGIDAYFRDAMVRAWDLDNPHGFVWRNDPHWLVRFVFVMGTHFMAMPPFHFSRTPEGQLIDDAQHQKRPLAIYAEGIRWLNLAMDMLNGQLDSVLGFAVPDIREPISYPVRIESTRAANVAMPA